MAVFPSCSACSAYPVLLLLFVVILPLTYEFVTVLFLAITGKALAASDPLLHAQQFAEP